MESNYALSKYAKDKKNHFESGIYEFNKIILHWDLRTITQPFALSPLPHKYSFPIQSTLSDSRYYSELSYDRVICDKYYESFKPHILEEARAIIATGLDALKNNKLKAFTIKIQRINVPKNSANPTSVKTEGKLPKETEGRSCLAMVIFIDKKFFFAIGVEEGIDTGVINIKFIADDEMLALKKFSINQTWQAFVLGSLVSHQRMYEVCTLKPNVNFIKDIIAGNLPVWSNSTINVTPLTKAGLDIKPTLPQKTKDISLFGGLLNKLFSFWESENSTNNFDGNNLQQVASSNSNHRISNNYSSNAVTTPNKLQNSTIEKLNNEIKINEAFKPFNKIQQSIAQKFLDAKESLYILQGPPGTGKTTTIVGILKALADKNKRIMLCAPSNKAVQVIATRFLKQYPDVKMALAGVENKLTEDLREIFIHSWNIFIAKQIIQYKNNLLSQLNIKQLLNLNLVNQLETFKIDILNKLSKIPETSIARITNLVSLRTPNCYRKIYENLKTLINEIKRYKENLKLIIENIDQDELMTIKNYYTSNANKTDENSQNNEQKPKLINDCEAVLVTIQYYLENIIEILSKTDLELEMLNSANVIFSTLSVAGRSIMREVNDIDILIIDEAGQTVEAETLIPFSLNPKKCLLVGDVNQLPATVISSEADKRNFGWSMMWRLLNECQQPYEILKIQYRMHAKIRQWPSDQYYQSMLQDGENIAARKLPYLAQNNFLFSPYVFISLSGSEEKAGNSFINEKEALVIIDTLKYFKQQANLPLHQHIGIISFYAGQVDLLKRLVKKENLGNIRIHTVDGFQGDENDIIFISFVRANHHANVGFLKDFRRLNVAITRPKHSLIMFGHLPTLEKAHNSDVAKLVTDIRQRNVLYTEQELIEIIKRPEPIVNPSVKLALTTQRNDKQPIAKPSHTPIQSSAKKTPPKNTLPKKAAPKKLNQKKGGTAKMYIPKNKQQKQNTNQQEKTPEDMHSLNTLKK